MIEYTVYVYPNGTKAWYLNGKRHREDGPAVEFANGNKYWYLNGKLHREDGPAVEYVNGTKSWYLNDQLHREDGPAVEYVNGNKYWCLNGKYLTKEQHQKRMNPVKERKFKVGDRVTAGAHSYGGAWQNLVVQGYYDDFSVWVVNHNNVNGSIRESELELIVAKELTVEEISNLLGYEVKIVK